jgi:putative PIN family toxin of toxin-antitoxin system
MNSKERYVFDTNTVISAFLFNQSNPGLALQQVLKEGELLLSMEVAEELADVLRRKKFDRYATRKIRDEFLRALIQESVFVDITEKIQVCRDAKDNKFLELAVSGGASYLITGDHDLLILHPFREISIVSPRKFIELSKHR